VRMQKGFRILRFCGGGAVRRLWICGGISDGAVADTSLQAFVWRERALALTRGYN